MVKRTVSFFATWFYLLYLSFYHSKNILSLIFPVSLSVCVMLLFCYDDTFPSFHVIDSFFWRIVFWVSFCRSRVTVWIIYFMSHYDFILGIPEGKSLHSSTMSWLCSCIQLLYWCMSICGTVGHPTKIYEQKKFCSAEGDGFV